VIAVSLAFIAFLELFPTVYKEQLKIMKAEKF